MAIPTYLLDIAPAPDGTFTVRLDRRTDDGTVHTLAPAAAGTALPIDWQGTCADARGNPSNPPAAFFALPFQLWNSLPAATREALTPALTGPARILLTAHGEATAAPWEFLATKSTFAGPDGAEQHPHAPFLRGQWSLVRRPPGIRRAPRKASEAPRHALLVIGSVRNPTSTDDPYRDLARIASAMRRAGFVVTVAAGAQATAQLAAHDLRVTEPLHSRARILDLLRAGDFTLFHYVGHAREGDSGGASTQLGGTDLRLDLGDREDLLPASELAPALRASRVRCAVFSACDLREAFATALLADSSPSPAPSPAPSSTHGPTHSLEHVLAMGAPVPLAVCAEWSAGFYESLRERSDIAAAAHAAAVRLLGSDLGRPHVWLPQHWSAVDDDLSFVTDQRVWIERICQRMVAGLDRFDGRFKKRLHPAQLADGDLVAQAQRDLRARLGTAHRGQYANYFLRVGTFGADHPRTTVRRANGHSATSSWIVCRGPHSVTAEVLRRHLMSRQAMGSLPEVAHGSRAGRRAGSCTSPLRGTRSLHNFSPLGTVMKTTLELPGLGELRLDGALVPRLSVLLLEDEVDGAKVKAEALGQDGLCDVDVAAHTAAADKALDGRAYDFVIADVQLEDPATRTLLPVQGDEWILKNEPRIRPGRCAVLTAHPDGFRRNESALSGQKIPIFLKARQEWDLFRLVRDLAQEKRERLVERLTASIRKGLGAHEPAPSELTESVRNVFVHYLRTRQDTVTPTAVTSTRTFSMEDLAREVEQHSEIGRRLLTDFVRELEEMTCRKKRESA